MKTVAVYLSLKEVNEIIENFEFVCAELMDLGTDLDTTVNMLKTFYKIREKLK